MAARSSIKAASCPTAPRDSLRRSRSVAASRLHVRRHPQPVVHFWQAVNTEGNELPVPVTTAPSDPRYYLTTSTVLPPAQSDRGAAAMPDASDPAHPHPAHRPRRPAGFRGHERSPIPSVVTKMPTFDVSLQGPTGAGLTPPGGLEWTPTSSDATFVDPDQGPANCGRAPASTRASPWPPARPRRARCHKGRRQKRNR